MNNIFIAHFRIIISHVLSLWFGFVPGQVIWYHNWLKNVLMHIRGYSFQFHGTLITSTKNNDLILWTRVFGLWNTTLHTWLRQTDLSHGIELNLYEKAGQEIIYRLKRRQSDHKGKTADIRYSMSNTVIELARRLENVYRYTILNVKYGDRTWMEFRYSIYR